MPDVLASGAPRARLNTRDHNGVVHQVHDNPDPIKLGRTACMKFFTWPIYTRIEQESRWTGTEAPTSCLFCIVYGYP